MKDVEHLRRFCGASSILPTVCSAFAIGGKNWLGLWLTPPFAERFTQNRSGMAASFRRRPVRLAAKQPHREHRNHSRLARHGHAPPFMRMASAMSGPRLSWASMRELLGDGKAETVPP